MMFPPNPEEFQRQMQEFLRQNFQSQPKSSQEPKTESSSEPDAPDSDKKNLDPNDFKFEYKPKDVKRHLDRFVIKQEEAKKVLSVALCDHYNHVRQCLEGQDDPNYAKQNILLIGPTGVGKTYLVRSMADLIGVPFVKADATKISETGYVGGDAEDLVRDLVRQAEGDVERAQFGIIYIDEIDKISAASNMHGGRDVSGRGVQTNLLKLMEETEVPARAPNDIAGQIQAMMDITQRRGKRQPSTINTKHILFVVSGAFDGLEPIVQKRLREATIGFAANPKIVDDADDVYLEARTRDFIDYGFEPEFIGRLPVRVVCQSLTEEDLFSILKSSEGSIVRQYEQSFGAYGIEVLFEEGGLRAIARQSIDEKTGARGLMTVCERIFRDIKFELPSTPVKQFRVTQTLAGDPAAALAKILEDQDHKEEALHQHVLDEFADRFEESHGLRLKFNKEAADELAALSESRSKPIRELCKERFKDFQFGLNLISKNTGQKEFEIDRATIQDPEKQLSEWVVASYRGDEKSENESEETKEENDKRSDA